MEDQEVESKTSGGLRSRKSRKADDQKVERKESGGSRSRKQRKERKVEN